MQVNVNIAPEILEWVLGQIKQDISNDQIIDCLVSWYHGEKTPTFNQVERISKATGIPLGYFFLKTPPMEDISLIEFRTVDSVFHERPSRDLIDTIHDMGQIQLWVRNHLISENASPISFVGEMKNITDYMIFAQRVRELLNIRADWYDDCKTAEDSFNHLTHSPCRASLSPCIF